MTLTCIPRSCVFLQMLIRSRHSEAWDPGRGTAGVMGHRLQPVPVMCSTCIQSSTASLLGSGIVRSPSAECFHLDQISSVQFSRSVMSYSLRPHEPQHARPPSITNCPSLPKLMSIESVMPSSHLILRCPLLLLPSIFPSIRVFSNE